MKIAIVTGASSGIGREFLKVLDKSEVFDEIWAIARRKERLEELQAETRAKIVPIALDLLVSQSFEELELMLKETRPEVKVLVNGSGFGIFGAFTERPLNQQLKIIDLNDKALVAVTYLVLPYMNAGSEIYNICSSSAFQPVPYEAIYGASKAFVMSFTRALKMELLPRKIHAMSVCPHWCKTEFFDTAVSDDTIVYYNFFNEADAVAKEAIKNMKKRKDISLCGGAIKRQVLAVKLLPHKFVMKTWCKQQKKTY